MHLDLFSDGVFHVDYERGVLPLELSDAVTLSRYLGAHFLAHWRRMMDAGDVGEYLPSDG